MVDTERVWEELTEVARHAAQHMLEAEEGVAAALIHGFARRLSHHARERTADAVRGKSKHPLREIVAGAAGAAAGHFAEQGVKKGAQALRNRARRQQPHS